MKCTSLDNFFRKGPLIVCIEAIKKIQYQLCDFVTKLRYMYWLQSIMRLNNKQLLFILMLLREALNIPSLLTL